MWESAWQAIGPSPRNLRYWQFGVLAAFLLLWQLLSRNQQYAFFLGEPIKVAGRVWSWFMPFGLEPNALFADGLPGNADIYSHLGTTLLETLLAFGIGTVLGLVCGLWLALAPTASAILEPYIKAANSMPRVILAPIFALWFGLGIWSKVALAVTLVFFIVFFNVYQGGAKKSALWCSPTPACWAPVRGNCFEPFICPALPVGSFQACIPLWDWRLSVPWWASIWDQPVALALILQAEGTFDVNTVFAGIVVLTAFALMLDGAVGKLEKRLMKWQPRGGETEKM